MDNSVSSAWTTDSFVAGVKPKMDGDKMHAILWKKSSKLFYLQFDFTASINYPERLYRDTRDYPFAVFMGSGTETINSATIYKAYMTGTSLKYRANSSTKTLAFETGFVFQTHFNNGNCMMVDQYTNTVDYFSFPNESLEFNESEFGVSSLTGYAVSTVEL